MKILLVEDETRLAEAIAASLTKKGIAVDHTALLGDAIELARQQTYDAIVLDRRLPDGDGITFIPWLRSSSVVTPVIVLTARNEPKERVAGLDLGADDYLGKPFLMEELFARLRAVMRRPSALAEPSIVLGRMTVDPIRMDVMVGELQLDLPRRELMVLVTLAKRKGKTVLRSVLETEIYNYEETIQSNALDAHVSRLRKRLTDADAGVSIHNIRGVGYLLKEH
ncbi:response regulator transcription factor [Rhizobium sp. 768_B6_N1_8]|uniref:response regulator transcription factor n=1 Tax=unclassified Rhizobium TaxID=2613769 RepID=UPI003F20C570